MTKYNKWVVIIAIAIVAITFGLLAIPNSFAVVTRGNFQLNGYEWTFAFKFIEKDFNVLRKVTDARVSVQTVVALVFALLSVPLVIIHKKSALYELLAGLLLIVSGFMFLLMIISAHNIYGGECNILWVTYVIGILHLIIGGLLVYVSVLLLKKEKEALVSNKSQGYSYLKKEDNKK